MWGLPTVERGWLSPGELKRYFHERAFRLNRQVLGHGHVFSHRRWQGVVVSGRAADPTRPLPPGWRWVAEEELDFLALPKVYEKALSIIKDPVQLELSLET